jgi:hypothetical protein
MPDEIRANLCGPPPPFPPAKESATAQGVWNVFVTTSYTRSPNRWFSITKQKEKHCIPLRHGVTYDAELTSGVGLHSM